MGNLQEPITFTRFQNLVLSFIKFEGKRDIPVTPSEVGFSLSLSLYLSLVGVALVYDIMVIAVF